MKLRIGVALAILFLGAVLGACEKTAPPAAHDSWHDVPASGFDSYEELYLPYVIPVAPAQQAEAEGRLRDGTWWQLSPSEAQYFTDSQVRVPRETMPYLVRGLTSDGGAVHVRVAPPNIWVVGEHLEDAPVVRQPVVVMLLETPIGVFVSSR
ncbi:MAG: hypothetical protein AAF384_09020 [Pseudomonadota bacterium]